MPTDKLTIPEIPENLITEVRSLARAAVILRDALAAMLEGHEAGKLLDEHADTLEIADKVVTTWEGHLQLEWEAPDAD